MTTDVEFTVKQLLAQVSQGKVHPSDLDINDPLQEIGIDSLSMIQLMVELEKTFRISISDEDIILQEEWAQTAGSLIKFISSKYRN